MKEIGKLAACPTMALSGEGLAMTEPTARRDVLLVAADLNERRLLFGELLEAGYEVMPVPGFDWALGALLQRLVEPRLIVIDVRDDEHATPQSVEHLQTVVGDLPLILVVGAIDGHLWEPLRPRVAAILHRPITIGQIVDEVRRRLPLNVGQAASLPAKTA